MNNTNVTTTVATTVKSAQANTVFQAIRAIDPSTVVYAAATILVCGMVLLIVVFFLIKAFRKAKHERENPQSPQVQDNVRPSLHDKTIERLSDNELVDQSKVIEHVSRLQKTQHPETGKSLVKDDKKYREAHEQRLKDFGDWLGKNKDIKGHITDTVTSAKSEIIKGVLDGIPQPPDAKQVDYDKIGKITKQSAKDAFKEIREEKQAGKDLIN